MTTPPDDTHSLESWLREKALEAHNEAERCKAKRESALTTEERVAGYRCMEGSSTDMALRFCK